MDDVIYSDDQTASALCKSGRCNLYGLIFITDGINSVTVDVYDSLTGSGTKVLPQIILDPTETDMKTRSIGFSPPIQMRTGVYVDITTSGTVTYKAYYNTKF